MISIAFTLALAVAPSLLLLWYFHARDLNPEPGRVVWATFGLGVLIVLPVVGVAYPISLAIKGIENPYLYGFADAFLTAAIPEELFKFLVVALYCSRHAEFDEPMDGIVYGAVASLGFATLENLMYVVGDGSSVVVARALSAVPGHAFMGAILGYYVGQARFGAPEERRANWLRAYLYPVVLHTLYDFPILTLHAGERPGMTAVGAAELAPLLVLVTLGVLVGEGIFVRRLVRRFRKAQEARASFLAHAQPTAAQPVTAAAAQRTAPTATGRKVGAVLWLLLGGLLVCGGSFVTLAVGLALVLMAVPLELGSIAILIVLGVAPLVAGVLLFRLGLRRPHRGAPEPAAVAVVRLDAVKRETI